MKIFKKILKIFLSNITTIVTIIGGVYLFFTYQKYTVEELLNYIISFLVFIAITLLIEKLVNLESIERKLKSLNTKLEQSNIFLNCRTSEFWEDAKKMGNVIFVSGGSLHFLIEKSGEIEALLKRGCKLEAVPVMPYSPASETLFNNVIKEIPSLDSFDNNINQTLSYLCNLKEQYPDKVVVRLNDKAPSLGIFAIYKDTLPISIQANIFSDKVSYDKRLSIRLTNSAYEHYFAYDYFCNQIDYLRTRLSECSVEQLKEIINLHIK